MAATTFERVTGKAVRLSQSENLPFRIRYTCYTRNCTHHHLVIQSCSYLLIILIILLII